tara:strand:- start:521 stop:802 length:282 start_codon:yes stop_codon:yes gene_type:complete
MKLNNQTLHELGMLDDNTEDETTFERLVDEYSVGRKPKYKQIKRRYRREKTAENRARRLAKRAREEQRANEKVAQDALEYQLMFDKINNNRRK